MNTTPELAAVLPHSDLLFDRATLQEAIDRIGGEIDIALDGERAVFMTVMHGALVFAGLLALSIETDLEFDYVHASRYRGDTAGGELEWLRRPQAELRGRTVLLVDDILDEGHTLKAVRATCLQMGARRVLVATLCRKQHQRLVEGLDSDFNGVVVPDRYVYGFGMDFHEQGRNLPAIYALRD